MESVLSLKCEFIFFSETLVHKYHEERLRKTFPEYCWKITAPDINRKPEEIMGVTLKSFHGCSLAWREDISHKVEEIAVTSPRFVPMKFLPNENEMIILISVYLPTGNQLSELKETLDQISVFITNYPVTVTIIMGGDINISGNSTRQKRRVWEGFLEEHSFVEVKPPDVTYEHRPNFGSTTSILDYFVIRDGGNVMNMKCENVKDGDLLKKNRSDHFPILGKFDILSTKKEGKTMDELYEKLNLPQHGIWLEGKQGEYDREVRKRFEKIESDFPEPGWTETKLELYSRVMGEVAREVMGPKVIRSRKCRLPKRMKVLLRELRRRKRKLKDARRNGRPRSEIDILINQVRTVTAAVSKRRQEFEKNQSEKLILKLNNPMDYYKYMRSTRQAKQSSIPAKMTTPVGTFYEGEVLDGLAKNFEYMGKFMEGEEFDEETKRTVHYLLDLVEKDSENSEKKIPNIGVDRLNEIISKLGADKACDIYGCKPKYIKSLSQETRNYILHLLNEMIEEKTYKTERYNIGKSTILHKGSGKSVSNINSYRRLTITPWLSKLLDRSICETREEIIKKNQSDGQYGFTSGRAYTMAILESGEIEKKFQDGGGEKILFRAVFDFQKAFPSMWRQAAILLLTNVDGPGGDNEDGEYLGFNLGINGKTRSRMVVEGYASKIFAEYCGAREGGLKSPQDFKFFVEVLLAILGLSEMGTSLSGLKVTATMVADDLIIYAESEEEMQGLVNLVLWFCSKYRMKLQPTKCKIVVNGTKKQIKHYLDRQPFRLGKDVLKCTTEAEYLGLVISSSGTERICVEKRIDKTRRSIYQMLSGALGGRMSQMPNIRLRTLNTFVSPALLASLCSVTVTNSALKLLVDFHKKVLRQMFGLGDRGSVSALYLILGILPIENELHKTTLTLFYQVWSAEDTRICKVFKRQAEEINQGTRNPSISRGWLSYVNRILEYYGLPSVVKLLNEKAPKAAVWKSMVKAKIGAIASLKVKKLVRKNSRVIFFDDADLLSLGEKPLQLIGNGNSIKQGRGIYSQIKVLTGNVLNRTWCKIEEDDWGCIHCGAVDGPTHWVECRELLRKEKIKRKLTDFRLFLAENFPLHPWVTLSTSRAKVCSLVNPYSIYWGGMHLATMGEQGDMLVSWCREITGLLVSEYENRSYLDRLNERRVHERRD